MSSEQTQLQNKKQISEPMGPDYGESTKDNNQNTNREENKDNLNRNGSWKKVFKIIASLLGILLLLLQMANQALDILHKIP